MEDCEPTFNFRVERSNLIPNKEICLDKTIEIKMNFNENK